MFFSYHLLELTLWPLLGGVGAFFCVLIMLSMMKGWGGLPLLYMFMYISFIMMVWWRDVIRESLFQGFHTKAVMSGLKKGFALFIVSEVLFFFSFFWGFFLFALNPTTDMGYMWPPVGLVCLDVMGVPLLNTLILLSSGIFLTGAHMALLESQFSSVNFLLFFCITLGMLFTYLQLEEYMHCSFGISDSNFGTIFFTLTGFHGVHVIIGTTFLLTVFLRNISQQMNLNHHVGFEMAAWYWHFVDVIWLYLFVIVYCWTML